MRQQQQHKRTGKISLKVATSIFFSFLFGIFAGFYAHKSLMHVDYVGASTQAVVNGHPLTVSIRSEIEPTVKPIATSNVSVHGTLSLASIPIQLISSDTPPPPVLHSCTNICSALTETYVRGNRSETSRRLRSRNDIPVFLNSLGLVGI